MVGVNAKGLRLHRSGGHGGIRDRPTRLPSPGTVIPVLGYSDEIKTLD